MAQKDIFINNIKKHHLYNNIMMFPQISTIIVYYKSLPVKYKISTLGYLGGIFLFNSHGCYVDSLNYLNKFRTNKLTNKEIELIKTEWDSVKYGANLNFSSRLFDSIIFPITTINNFIPSLVLLLNKK